MNESFRPAILDIYLQNLVHNYSNIKSYVTGRKVLAVLKANAYGHGLVECAKALSSAGADYFGVALIEEALVLRQAGITEPVLVFGGILSEQLSLYLANNIDVTASSIDKLRAIDGAAALAGKKADVHLKLDTGMGRIGVQYYNCRDFFLAAKECKNIEIKGVFSHLACAGEDESFNSEQIRRFRDCVAIYKEIFLQSSALFHLANSAATLDNPEAHFDMVRPGLALYGACNTDKVSLKPCMRLSTKIVYFKVLPKGAGVSYGLTWKAEKQTRVVTLPIGYGDGFFRELSNRGSVLIRGKRYPIVGKVCMDQMMVNVGDDEAYNGDEVVLLGQQGTEEITVSEIASLAHTVEHEVLCSTNLRVPRRYHF